MLATTHGGLGAWVHTGGWSLWLWAVVAVLAIVVLFLLLFRAGEVPAGRPPRERERARRILTERHARGELSTDEYEERLRRLA